MWNTVALSLLQLRLSRFPSKPLPLVAESGIAPSYPQELISFLPEPLV
ncbi:hypothetical protein HMPREF1981_02959 [Bacteroides pyogenes F0041]|uniref:Uncharacterized protein n=1 Tax=Bacteroides pyogenes F0041 TaxID=1321819 RepID=U2CCN9_9BACE|nr:hypothetical protein HMPREF1981_02959 [Bacteroides pyogenes F0041]